MVIWPQYCWGCNESDPSTLKKYTYTWSKNYATTSESRNTTGYDTKHMVNLGVTGYLCSKCLKTVKKKRLKTWPIGIPFIVVGLLLGILVQETWALISGVFALFVGLMIILLVLTQKPVKFFGSFNYSTTFDRKHITYKFASADFTRTFKRVNPDGIKVDK